MKGFCYIVLILGFFIFYQQNPVYAIVVIVLFIGVYLFFKSRSSSGRGAFGFLSGNQAQHNNKMDDLITLMMLQQYLSSDETREQRINEKKIDQKANIDNIKSEVLDLLDEE